MSVVISSGGRINGEHSGFGCPGIAAEEATQQITRLHLRRRASYDPSSRHTLAYFVLVANKCLNE